MLQANPATNTLFERVVQHINAIYSPAPEGVSSNELAHALINIMRLSAFDDLSRHRGNHWSERDVIMITYGDSLLAEGEKPLATLRRFLDDYTEGLISAVHVLPFYPWSSDDGFSVLDYSSVNEALGKWVDINHLAEKYDLMADLVINHCSSRSLWFENFLQNEEPGKDYFFTADPSEDYSAVVRPRTSQLLRPVQTISGERHVWCTFSHDQVDLNFRNPEVLKQFAAIIRQYLDEGVRIFRLDAVAFLWKVPGTSCLNLDQTHEIVRLLRTLVEHARGDAVLVTETNIPNRENLSYFGNANEAHWVYNFSLPPLLLHTLVSGDCSYLKQWLMSMPPARNGTAYFNFIASHDGIGLRPAEGLLSDDEMGRLIETMQTFGGHVSFRALEGGEQKPYEINISLYDALQGTLEGADQWGQERFICAHTIMFALEGIPGIYVHSLLGTRNDYARMEHSGHFRSINRHQWDFDILAKQLDDRQSHHGRLFAKLKKLLAIRTSQAAFHPNATQFTLQFGAPVFGFWRQSIDRAQSIFCISNITNTPQEVLLSEINLIDLQQWQDLISGEHFSAHQNKLLLRPYQTVWITNEITNEVASDVAKE